MTIYIDKAIESLIVKGKGKCPHCLKKITIKMDLVPKIGEIKKNE